MAKYMKVINVSKEKVKLKVPTTELSPTHLYFKEDGTIDNTPSLVIVADMNYSSIAFQMSLNTLKECLEEVGYTISKV